MMTDPEPNKVRSVNNRQRPVVQADTNGPEPTNLLDVKRGMTRIGL